MSAGASWPRGVRLGGRWVWVVATTWTCVLLDVRMLAALGSGTQSCEALNKAYPLYLARPRGVFVPDVAHFDFAGSTFAQYYAALVREGM